MSMRDHRYFGHRERFGSIYRGEISTRMHLQEVVMEEAVFVCMARFRVS